MTKPLNMHRTKNTMMETMNQSNASWPLFEEQEWKGLHQSITIPKEVRVNLAVERSKLSFPVVSRRSKKLYSGSTYYHHHKQECERLRSHEVKHKLLARVHAKQLLESLRTDQFVGKFNPVAHSIYTESPDRRLYGKTISKDTASVCSSLSSGSPSCLRLQREKLNESTPTSPLRNPTLCCESSSAA